MSFHVGEHSSTGANATMSVHAKRRSRQRAVSRSMVEFAIEYGQPINSYGDVRFLLTDRVLAQAPPPVRKLSDRLRGLFVVVAENSVVRTVGWDFSARNRPGRLRKRRLRNFN